MMEIVHTTKDRRITYAIAGGKMPKASFVTLFYGNEQLKEVIPEEDYSNYIESLKYEYMGSIELYSELLSLFSEGGPVILYTAEGGTCDTCLEIFLKYGKGKRPDFDKLSEMRNCMNDYDGDIIRAAMKTEKMLDVLLSGNLYSFEYCVGIMGDIRGDFTWDRYQSHNYLPGASNMSHVYDMYVRNPKITDEQFSRKGRSEACISKYVNAVSLLASQPPEAFSEERVEYYRRQIREGNRFGCVALKIKSISNYAIILDGHHRVLASMLEGVFPDCLLISESRYRLMVKGGETLLKLPPKVTDNVRKTGIPDLPSDALEFLRSNLDNIKKEAQPGELEIYKHYRDNTDTRNFKFPPEYSEAAEKMIDRIFNKD
jgi:hypothetical protein